MSPTTPYHIISYRACLFFSVPLPLPEHVSEFLQRAPIERRFLPQVRRQEAVRVAHGDEGGFERVLEGLCRAGGGSVDVLDAGELEETLDGWGGDEAGTAGGGDELVQYQFHASCIEM